MFGSFISLSYLSKLPVALTKKPVGCVTNNVDPNWMTYCSTVFDQFAQACLFKYYSLLCTVPIIDTAFKQITFHNLSDPKCQISCVWRQNTLKLGLFMLTS